MSTLFVPYTVRMTPGHEPPDPDYAVKVVFRQSDLPFYHERELRAGWEVSFTTYGLAFRVHIRTFARGVYIDLS